MNDLGLVREAIEEFVSSDTKRTLLLKGSWGVGKTYFWNEFVDEFDGKQTDRECFKYAYVSLFGLKDIDSVKLRILEQSQGMLKWLSKGSQVASDVGAIASLFGVNLDAPEKSAAKLADTFIDNFLICFDDIERKHEDLKLEELFGLIDYLCDRKQCQCVLVLNESELDSKEDVLKRYRDKIIDIEVLFNPSLERNLDVAFASDFEETDKKIVSSVLSRFDSRNIRTIKRIKWVLEKFEETLNQCEQIQRNRLVEQISILTVFRYEHASDICLSNITALNWLIVEMERGEDKQTSKAEEIVAKAKYLPYDLDEFIIDYLQNGLISDPNFIKVREKWLSDSERSNAVEKLDALYNSVWAGFSLTQDKFLDRAKQFIDENLAYMTLKELQDLLALCKRLHPSFDETAPMARFIDTHLQSASLKNTRELLKLKLDSKAEANLKKREMELLRSHPIAEIVEKLSRNNSWNRDDFEYLNTYTEAELLAHLESKQNGEGVYDVRGLVEKLRSPETTAEIEVLKKIVSCLKELGKRNELNKMRVEKDLTTASEYLQKLSSSSP